MQILVKLSGDHPSLPLAEVRAICHPANPAVSPLGDRTVHLSEGDAARIASRAGLAHWAGDMLGEAEAIADLPEVDLEGATYRLDVKGCPEGEAKQARGECIRRIRNGRVELSSPNRRLLLHKADCWRLADVRKPPSGFSGRTPIKRPFFTPVSIMPRLARAMVNLSRTLDGGSIADPMCGTGGILIEAGLIGYALLASDIDGRMVAGTGKNLKHFGLSPRHVATAPVSLAPAILGKADGIVTDPPYGKASTTNRQGRDRVVMEAFSAFAEMLHRGRRASLAVPDPAMLDSCAEDFSVEEIHAYKIHGTLTRHFAVLKRK